MLQLDRYQRADDFLADAQEWLVEREAEHNLILGLGGRLAWDPHAYTDDPPYFVLVRSAAGPVAAAIRTPPMNLVLSEVNDPAALRLIADDLEGVLLPGVTGPPDPVRHFGELWTGRHGGHSVTLMDERIYQLTTVVPPSPVTGGARRATADDRRLLSEWIVSFHEEALPAETENARQAIDGWDPETGRQFWIWEDAGRPVALVGSGNPTPRGMRIGPVYTPPQDRGRGYASNLTAFVSQRMLDEGWTFCFLYTDLANPTSNHIYTAIGYRPVADALMIGFTG